MIVVEERLRDLFAQIPEIQLNSNVSKKPFFGWGRDLELNRYIEKYDSAMYPLIWLLPSTDTYNVLSNRVERDAVFILATRETREDLFNPQRYEGSFKDILNPLTDYVIQALQNSNTTRITDLSTVSILKEPNYSVNGENAAIDKWDAIRIECSIEVNDQCLNTLKWK